MLGLAESGRFQFMFDKRILRNPPEEERAVRLDKRSPVCDNCWRELWFQMIFMFVKEHAYLMPDTIKNRPVCYWGINCRTMAHNLEHAKKFNHMEYQTRFWLFFTLFHNNTFNSSIFQSTNCLNIGDISYIAWSLVKYFAPNTMQLVVIAQCCQIRVVFYE